MAAAQGTPLKNRIPDLSLLKTDLNPLEAAAQMKVEAVSKMQSSVELMTATKVESEVEKSVMATVEAAVVDNVTPQLQSIGIDINAVEDAAEMKMEDLSALKSSIEASSSSTAELDAERRVMAAAEFTAARNLAQAIPVSPPPVEVNFQIQSYWYNRR